MGALGAGGVTQFWWELDSEARNHVWVGPRLPREAGAQKEGGNMRSDGERAQRERKQEGEWEPSAEKVLERLKAQSEGLLRPSC